MSAQAKGEGTPAGVPEPHDQRIMCRFSRTTMTHLIRAASNASEAEGRPVPVADVIRAAVDDYLRRRQV